MFTVSMNVISIMNSLSYQLYLILCTPNTKTIVCIKTKCPQHLSAVRLLYKIHHNVDANHHFILYVTVVQLISLYKIVARDMKPRRTPVFMCHPVCYIYQLYNTVRHIIYIIYQSINHYYTFIHTIPAVHKYLHVRTYIYMCVCVPRE